MANLRSLGLSLVHIRPPQPQGDQLVILQRPLDRIFAFTGYSIDDVVENPIAKNAVLGYFKLHKQIIRSSETVDLERQWNP